MDVKVAVASGLSNAKIIMDKIRAKEADYHFVEIMCCPGGCVNGGGQPQVHADVRNFEDVKAGCLKGVDVLINAGAAGSAWSGGMAWNDSGVTGSGLTLGL